jgi:branched-chain amino acid transport system permease protein
MAPLAPTLVSGLTVGLLYGLFALAIVVLYRSTGLINFALGGLATVPLFVVWELAASRGWPLVPATLVGGGVAIVLGIVAYLGAMRVRQDADAANLMMRTLALLMVLQAAVQDRWGQGQPFRFALPLLPDAVEVLGVRVPGTTLAAVVLAVVVIAGGRALFERTRLGLQLRAVADSRDIAALVGIRTAVTAGAAWAGAALVAFAAGALAAPNLMLSTYMFDGLLLYAFTAVVCAGLTSLGGALVVGIAVGLVGNVLSVYLGPEFALVCVFGILLLTLSTRPQGFFGDRLAVERL